MRGQEVSTMPSIGTTGIAPRAVATVVALTWGFAWAANERQGEDPQKPRVAARFAGMGGPSAEGGEREGPAMLFDRSRWFFEMRLGPDGTIPWSARSRALAQLEENLRSGLLHQEAADVAADSWVAIGPSPLYDGSVPYSGRVTAIAHPQGSSTMAYVGAAQGGIWKTTDTGATWTPLTDDQSTLAIGSIAVAPSNSSIVYAGTGEPNQSCDSYFGAGILRSQDAGVSWTLVGQSTFDNTSVGRIVVHPTDPNILWAGNGFGAGGFRCYGLSGSFGVWKSTNGGTSWTKVLGSSQIGFEANVYDVVIDPLNADVLYAAVDQSGVWKTTNGGTSWSKLGGGLPTTDVGRVDLAIRPGQSAVMYAAYEEYSTGRFLGTWKTLNSGSNWAPLTTPSGSCHYWNFDDPCTYEGGSFGQCWYDLAIEADGDGGVWLGGIALFRSPDGGSTWVDICPADVHVDQHAIALPSSGVAWLGNDGGVFRTTDNGSTWSNKNVGLGTAQFYPGASLHPTDRDQALGGTQDNGTLYHSGTTDWTEVFGGDGSFSALDFTDPENTAYVSYQYLNIWKTTDAGANWYDASTTTGLTDANTGEAAFIAPYVMCPSDAQVLVAGSDNVWRTDDGAAVWSSNSPDPLNPSDATIFAVAFAPSDTTCDTYFVGLSDGSVYRTTAGGGPSGWTDITGTLPTRAVSDIGVHPGDAATVYVAYSGFGGPHLYKSTNALAASPTWSPSDTGIPDTPVNAVLVDPDTPGTVYLGTDVGIFRSTDGGATWGTFMGGHPNVAVFDLVADSSTETLMSFSHGRSAFRTPSCTSPEFGGVDSAADVGACSATGIQVNWTVPADWGFGASSGTYDVRRYAEPGCSEGLTTVASGLVAATSGFTDTTAAPGTTYYYQVVATNNCARPKSSTGTSPCSAAVADASDTTPCANVGSTLFVSKGALDAELTWTGVACADLAGYEVFGTTAYSAPFSGGWTSLGTPAGTTFSDPLGSVWIGYKTVSVDACGNRSPN
jgi:photosystem II stability/assembly factor-like uncharacterized protein